MGVPGAVISRLRTALSGPLGSIGDQLIWAGWVPALVGIGLIAAPWVGIWAIVGIVLVHNILRFWITAWGLDLGLREGLRVGAALQRSWLPRVAEDAQRIAAFAVGVAVPIVAWRVLLPAPAIEVVVTIGAASARRGAVTAPGTRARVNGLRFGLALLGVAILLVGGLR